MLLETKQPLVGKTFQAKTNSYVLFTNTGAMRDRRIAAVSRGDCFLALEHDGSKAKVLFKNGMVYWFLDSTEEQLRDALRYDFLLYP